MTRSAPWFGSRSCPASGRWSGRWSTCCCQGWCAKPPGLPTRWATGKPPSSWPPPAPCTGSSPHSSTTSEGCFVLWLFRDVLSCGYLVMFCVVVISVSLSVFSFVLHACPCPVQGVSSLVLFVCVCVCACACMCMCVCVYMCVYMCVRESGFVSVCV